MENFIISLAKMKKYYINLTSTLMRLIVSHSSDSHRTHVENPAGCYLHLDAWQYD